MRLTAQRFYCRKPHFHDLYDIDVSPDLISTVTDAVLDEVATWQ